MDSVSGYAAGVGQPRTGGKIVRPRRTAAVRTPYDRPVPRSRDPPQQNPSWISRLVYKPASVIASGAGKFISSVVFSDSSSSSEEDEDSSSGLYNLFGFRYDSFEFLVYYLFESETYRFI